MKEEYSEVKTTLILVLVLNLLVTIAKLVFGILANSLAMIADGIHSLFDSTSNVIGLFAISRASKPADIDHPYGHRKYEVFATTLIALLLLVTGFEILEGVYDRVKNPKIPDITTITILVMVGTMIINYFVSRFELRKGIHLHSPILIADSKHTKSDVYVSLSVIAGFAAIKIGYVVVDPAIAILIAFLIFRMGYKIMKSSSKTLCDTSPLDPVKIREAALKVRGVLGSHRIRSHGLEDEAFVDLHIILSSKTPLGEAHEISHKVEEAIKEKFGNVRDVIVHIEPED
ncbi:MAG: cation diffusion facilitator family transporter [Methanobacteriota archaeon]